MMKWLFCAVLVALLVVPAIAAAPTFFGPTGLIVMPTAESLAPGQVQIFANHISRDDAKDTAYGGNVGLGHGLEIGATASNETGPNVDTEYILNAKWTAIAETDAMPAIAIGGINLLANDDFRGTFITKPGKSEADPYIVLSKKLPGSKYAVSGHAGYIGGSIAGIMLGGGARVTPNLDVMADWIDNFTGFSFGARYQPTNDLGLSASIIDGDFAAGISYSFGLK